jgi:hypothetical protein
VAQHASKAEAFEPAPLFAEGGFRILSDPFASSTSNGSGAAPHVDGKDATTFVTPTGVTLSLGDLHDTSIELLSNHVVLINRESIRLFDRAGALVQLKVD